MKTLKNAITFQPMMTSYVACLKAISDYMKLEHSIAWIAGVCGYAFIINIHPELCPSSPTSFYFSDLKKLTQNLGFTLSGYDFCKNDQDFELKQKQVWEHTKVSIDKNLPCFGWEMSIPEFYPIYGYDVDNYVFIDFNGKKATKRWSELGLSNIGWVFIQCAIENDVQADVYKSLKDTFIFLLQFAKSETKPKTSNYFTGIKAYDFWIDALHKEKVNPFGLSYNSAIWAECRQWAHQFLLEAKAKIRSNLLDDLIEHYEIISWSLKIVAQIFPFPLQSIDWQNENIDDAIDHLTLAKEAEKTAYTEIKRILPQL